jgi:hypothetical protein
VEIKGVKLIMEVEKKAWNEPRIEEWLIAEETEGNGGAGFDFASEES